MSDTGLNAPSVLAPQLLSQSSNGWDAGDVSLRVKLLAQRNPYMAARPDALQAMATSPYDTQTLMQVGNQMYAMQTADTIRSQLEQMSPAGQRATLALMGPYQAAALSQMGFQPAQEPEDSLLSDIVGLGAKALTPISKGLGALGGVPIIGEALDALAWVGAIPAHLYRTVRLLDKSGQMAGALGAIAGIIAVATAIPTGGGSLAALGMLGLGGIGGAALGSYAVSSITNPGDWTRAFASSWNGERTFDDPSVRRATELLGDPRLVGLAQDLADVDGVDLVQLAREVAGESDLSMNRQLGRLEELAAGMANRGTPEFDQALSAMYAAVQDPIFQEAVQTLVHGKISPGRDLADAFGLDPDTSAYNLVSGLTDAAFTIAVDPTLLGFKAAQLYRVRRYTVGLTDGAVLASNFRQIASKPAIRRLHDVVVESVNDGARGFQTVRSMAPEFLPGWDDLVRYRDQLRQTSGDAARAFTHDDLVDWYTGAANVSPLLKGIGTMRMVNTWQLRGLSIPRVTFRKFRLAARQFNVGLGDQSLLRRLEHLSGETGFEDMRLLLPPEAQHVIDQDGVIRHVSDFSPSPAAYTTGKLVSNIPLVGRPLAKLSDVITAATTMSLTGKAIALNGPNMARDVTAMMELGRYMGLPSFARAAYIDTIVKAESTATRAAAVHGWLANMIKLTGIESTAEGRKLLEQYIEHSRKAYGAADELVINGHRMHVGIFTNDQADMIIMPDLHELVKAVRVSHTAKLMGYADLPILNTAVNKVWKPLVLLRLAFIPRAAGEEAANFLLRGGFGSLTDQHAASYIGKRRAYAEAQEKASQIARGMDLVHTRDELALLQAGPVGLLPKVARPVYRIAARWGHAAPAQAKLDSYAAWLADTLEEGLAPGKVTAWRTAAERWSGAPLESIDKVALTTRGFAANRRLNVASYADSIVLGNPRSIRRMLLGGVDDVRINGMTEWWQMHATTVMREGSAVNAGPIDPLYDERELKTVIETGPDGELTPTVVLPDRGRRRRVGQGDPVYEHAVHNNISRWMEDPAMREVARDVFSRVTGQSVNTTEAQLDSLVHELWALGRNPTDLSTVIVRGPSSYAAREIVYELMDRYDHNTWEAMISELAGGADTAPIARALADLPQAADPTLDSIIQSIDGELSVMHQLASNGATIPADEFVALNEVKAILERQTIVRTLQEMDAPTRAFATQWLETQGRLGSRSWYHKRLYGHPAPTETLSRADQHIIDLAASGKRTLTKRDRDTLDRSLRSLRRRIDSGDVFLTPAQRAQLAAIEQARLEAPLLSRRTAADRLIDDPLADHVAVYGQLLDATRQQGRPSSTWLYRNANEAFDDAVSVARSALLDPNNTREGVTHSLRAVQRDELGQVVDTFQKEASVVLWHAPRLDGWTFERLLQATPNNTLILEHEAEVRQLALLGADDVGYVANRALAEELQRIVTEQARARGPVEIDHLRMAPDVLNRDDVARRLTSGDRPGAWSVPREYSNARRAATPSAAIDPIDELAQAMVSQAVRSVARDGKARLMPKPRTQVLDDGTVATVPSVYRWDRGNLAPYPLDQSIPLSDRQVIRNEHGEMLDTGNPDYFERIEPGATAGDMLWEIYGPMMRDLAADVSGQTRWRRKDLSLTSNTGPMQAPEMVPVRRSSVADVRRVTSDDLPSYAIGEVYANRKLGKWEQIVQHGFDRVIGPAIDALARRPMSIHAYLNRYEANHRQLQWLIDPELRHNVESFVQVYRKGANSSTIDYDRLVDNGRILAVADGNTAAQRWKSHEVSAWLRGHTDDELIALARRVKKLSVNNRVNHYTMAAKWLENSMTTPQRFRTFFEPDISFDRILARVERNLPDGALVNSAVFKSEATRDAIRGDAFLAHIDDENQWDMFRAAAEARVRLGRAASEGAATAAINDIVPFIDSHEFKTQWADHGKGFLPFWYAEENFLKRWARGLADSPELARKAQLTYMGMKEVGIIRTDSSGRDYFIYPGSGLLVEAIDRIIPREKLPIEVLFQTPTDSMLPGVNNRFGTPSFNPLVTVPLDLAVTWFPELQPVERALLGDFASEQGVVNQVVPAHLRNLFLAATGNEQSYARYSSAMMSAIAHMEAHGQGLPDDATAGERDAYMDRVREHARIVVLAQAIGGLFLPGSPQPVEAEDGVSFTGIGLEDAAGTLADEYIRLVRMFGIEDGTAKYLEANANNTVHDIINPLAYTVPKNVSVSGAPIASTNAGLEFYDENQAYFDQLPNAAPWLFSTTDLNGARSQYAYDQMVANGLRRRRSSDEMLAAIKFKQGASEYFVMRTAALDQIAAAEAAGDTQKVAYLQANMDYQLNLYKIAHPLFAHELQSSDGKQRRELVISEMRTIINDPGAPQVPHLEALGRAMRAFDTYTTELRILSDRRTNQARLQAEQLKQSFVGYMDDLTRSNPGIMSFWVSVLRPESSLE